MALTEEQKERLRQSLRTLPAEEDRLKVEAGQAPEEPSDIPLWQKPLSFLYEKVFEPWSVLLTSPFTPSTPGTEGKDWYTREREEYRAWEAPSVEFGKYPSWMPLIGGTPISLGVKGAVELSNPLMWLPAGVGISKGAQLLSKLGLRTAGRAVGAAGRAVTAVEELPGRAISAGIRRVFPKKTGVFAELQPIDQAIEIATTPDALRRLSTIPQLRPIAERIGGLSAVAVKDAEKARVGYNMLVAEAKTKVEGIMAPLRGLGDPKDIFKLGDDEMVKLLSGKSVHLNTILSNPSKYAGDLLPLQNQWIETAQTINRSIKPYLELHGIKINELTFSEGGEWAGRKVVGKLNAEGELVEAAFVGPGPGARPGTKLGLEKTRIFDNIEDAIKEGFRYVSSYDTIKLNTLGAYKRVAHQEMANWLLERAPWRSMEVFSLPKANNLVNKALQKKSIKPSQIDALTRDMPEVARMLSEALAETNWEVRFAALQNIKTYLKQLVPTNTENLFWYVEELTQKRRIAQNTVGVLQRIKRGESLPTGTVKAISRVVPDIAGRLSEVSKTTLDDLVRAGAEAAEFPKILPVPYGQLKKLKKALNEAHERLIRDPNNTAIVKEIAEIKQQLGFTKYRVSLGEPMEFAKSPTSILREARLGREVGKAAKVGPDIETVVRELVDEVDAVKSYMKKAKHIRGGPRDAFGMQAERLLLKHANPEFVDKVWKKLEDYMKVPSEGQSIAEWKQARGKIWTEVIDSIEAIKTSKPFRVAEEVSGKVVLPKTFDAIDEMITVLRGEPYKTTTATGREVMKYRGGLIKEFIDKEAEAKALRAKVVETARRVKFEEAQIAAPAFAGKIFIGPNAKETARIITQSFNQDFSNALAAINQVNAVGRFMVLAGDASPFAIQLIFLAGMNPRIWGKSINGFVHALFDKKFHANYLANHVTTIEKATGLRLAAGGVEMTEAMTSRGLLRKKPFTIAGKVLEPFARGYETAIDVAGIELRKSLDYLATTPARAAQVDAFINEFRGLVDRARIGVNPVQRQLETAALLAPQYNMAIAALLTDVFRGNLRGSLARKSLAQGVAAIGAMTIAVSIAMGEDWDEIAEHLNPNSPKFMTWNIAGQNVGPGSKVRSVIKLWADSVDNPDDLWNFSMKNPALRFVRGNLSPVVSTGLDLITGKDYSGDPTRDGLLSFTKNVVGENLMPIWIQTVAMEGGEPKGRALRGAAEFFGLRSYPESKFVTYQNRLAELSGNKYKDLQPQEIAYLEKQYPELVGLRNAATEDLARRGYNPEQVDFWAERAVYSTERDRILEWADEEFRAGNKSGQWLREIIQNSGQDLGAKYETLETRYPRVIEEMEKRAAEKSQEFLEKGWITAWAEKEYWGIMFDPVLEDKFGNVDYDERERRLNQLQQNVGPTVWKELTDWIQLDRAEKPESVQAYYKAQEILKPYWQIESNAWAKRPDLKPYADRLKVKEEMDSREAKKYLYSLGPMGVEIYWIRKQIVRDKKIMRAQNPEIDAAIRIFY